MSAPPSDSRARRTAQVLRTALGLGLTSFGGPIAHLGYFERVYVGRLGWLSGADYSALVSLCQLLPGPTSSQVGFLIGLRHAGWSGALAAWLGFTLPAALALYGAALAAARLASGPIAVAVAHGLKLAAVAVVAQAVWTMAGRQCRERATAALALGAAAAMLLAGGGTAMQLAVLAVAALAGSALCRGLTVGANVPVAVPPAAAYVTAALFLALLLLLPLLATLLPHGYVALAAVFYRSGALVFGGGHVVLPLLREALVPPGAISDDGFLTGYGLAQAVPGPLFAVAAYLGAANSWTQLPALAATVALVGIFLPGLLLATAALALWESLARHAALRAAMTGINAAVVGILAAALYDPLWTTAVHGTADVALAAGAALLLLSGRVPPLAIVALCTLGSVVRTV